jgi:dTDP-4-dehydrorhamnose reductase
MPQEQQQVVLLGAGGQLGRQWKDFLIDHRIPHAAFTSAEASVTDAEKLNQLFLLLKPAVVINCAAYTKVDKAETEQEAAFAVNAEAVHALAEMAVRFDFLLVHYSTDYVFSGGEAEKAAFPQGFPVDAPVKTCNTYGESKLKGEQYLLTSSARFLNIRVAWLCGKHGANFVKTMLRLGKEKPELRVVADQLGAPSFAENVVFNSWQLIQSGETGIFHIASTDACTWFELAQETLRWSGIGIPVHPISTSDFPTPAKRAAYSRLDVSKTATVPGIVLTGWKQGLHNLLTELQES